ncbi:hypothetical protein BDP81DRAFT_409519 [Colletotrichum phormii]|uniref:Uncharacterized protein n=1 Tax=Colletotrichum phormii TaxID=359342 RepID=A0AAJ0ED44_9PEZI|nr:uncharacterized protein BDP81DRAFT_409519 [Colletotrichum phormii]KAK1625217.1 hypothetical protein BDP81DRAFT_409519 [Colletotrichum phormii]
MLSTSPRNVALAWAMITNRALDVWILSVLLSCSRIPHLRTASMPPRSPPSTCPLCARVQSQRSNKRTPKFPCPGAEIGLLSPLRIQIHKGTEFDHINNVEKVIWDIIPGKTSKVVVRIFRNVKPELAATFAVAWDIRAMAKL